MRILSIDYGEKRIGLGYVDTDSILIAQPLEILNNQEALFDDLSRLVDDKKIDKVILGYPRSLSGSTTQQTGVVKEFGDKLKLRLGLPVEYQDETLSTVTVREELSEDPKGARRRVDDQAAALILQDYIEQHVR